MDRQTRAPIIERKTRLDGSVQEFACERLLLEPGRRAVLRYVLDRDWRLDDAGLVVPKGAVTISHYWMDRPYNVYHWLAGGRTLAYYCNVAEQTEISDDLIAYTDLVVDVLLRPSGEALVVDEEELPPDLDARRRGLVARATEAIVTNGKRIAAEVEKESRALL